MPQIIFRPSINTDIYKCALIISTTEAWTTYGIDYEAAYNLLTNMEDKIYVAEIENSVVGFTTLRINGMGNFGAYIRMVAIEKKFRGNGIGKRLIGYICSIAFEHTPNLFLICSVNNSQTRTFYERLGFKQVGLIPDLVVKGHDEILYRKSNGTIL